MQMIGKGTSSLVPKVAKWRTGFSPWGMLDAYRNSVFADKREGSRALTEY